MPKPQLFIFTYHKTGTVLVQNIVRGIAPRLGLRVAELLGMTRGVDPAVDLVLVPHGLLEFRMTRPFRAVRLIRDPRDIWLSGYLYHRSCNEPWCVNTDFDARPPIGFPLVPRAFEHRRERWKRDYLARLGGKSYQQNLLDRDRDSGLEFELNGYTACTLEDMRAWPLRSPEVLDLKLERIAQDFDGAVGEMFRHLGFSGADLATILDVARAEDVGRMDDAAIAGNPHIHCREISKWRKLLSAGQVRRFEQLYGDLVVQLGYQLAG